MYRFIPEDLDVSDLIGWMGINGMRILWISLAGLLVTRYLRREITNDEYTKTT